MVKMFIGTAFWIEKWTNGALALPFDLQHWHGLWQMNWRWTTWTHIKVTSPWSCQLIKSNFKCSEIQHIGIRNFHQLHGQPPTPCLSVGHQMGRVQIIQLPISLLPCLDQDCHHLDFPSQLCQWYLMMMGRVQMVCVMIHSDSLQTFIFHDSFLASLFSHSSTLLHFDVIIHSTQLHYDSILMSFYSTMTSPFPLYF